MVHCPQTIGGFQTPDFEVKHLISEGDKFAELRAFVIRRTIPERVQAD